MYVQKKAALKAVGVCLTFLTVSVFFQNCGQVGSLKVSQSPANSTETGANTETPIADTPTIPETPAPVTPPPVPTNPLTQDPHYKQCVDLTPNCTEIETPADFNYWANAGGSGKLIFRLKNDIDFGGGELTQFFLNESIFDGNNFQIKNYTIHYITKKGEVGVSIGTFSQAYSSIITRLKISDFKIYVTHSESANTRPYNTASLAGYLNNSTIINSSASNGLIETVPNVWYIGGLVGQGCYSEVYSSSSNVHVSVKSIANVPTSYARVAGLVGGFPCGNNVNIIMNSFSSSTVSEDAGATRGLKLYDDGTGGYSALLVDKVYNNLDMQNPSQASWDFSKVWLAANDNSKPTLRSNLAPQYKALKFSALPKKIKFDSCEKVTASMTDASGIAFVPQQNWIFKTASYGLVAYANANDCQQKSNALMSLNYTAGSSETSFYVRTDFSQAPTSPGIGVQLLLVHDFIFHNYLNVSVETVANQ